MHMGMSQSMSMCHEMVQTQSQQQRLEHRQELEQKLEHKLEHQQKHEIKLEQYLHQEDFIKGLIRWTQENKAWVKFKKLGFDFKYASVPYKMAQPIADIAGCGFAHCMYDPFDYGAGYSRGSWTLFVVNDLVPKNFHDLVAIHERGEQLSLGNHYFASKLEFAAAKEQSKLVKYVKFIDEEHPSKFYDVTQEVLFPILPDDLRESLEENKVLDEEVARAEELIGKNPIHESVLRMVFKYEALNQHVYESLRKIIGPTQLAVANALANPGRRIEEVADIVDRNLSAVLRVIDPHDAKALSRSGLNELLNDFFVMINHNVYDELRRTVQIETNFPTAYAAAINNRRVAVPTYTVEDVARNPSLKDDIKGYDNASQKVA